MDTPAEHLSVSREEGSAHDTYAVRVCKAGTGTVGHGYFTSFCSIVAESVVKITGHRKKGHGLEVPCMYHLTGDKKLVKKAQEIVKDLEKKKESSK